MEPPAGPPPPPNPVAQPPPPPTAAMAPGYDPRTMRPVLPPVSEEVLKIPLGTRELIRQSLDLLTRSDSGLRGPSFYIGFILLVTLGPALAIAGLGLVMTPAAFGDPFEPVDPAAPTPFWPFWLLAGLIPAFLGYVAASVEAAGMATAVIGGRVEGRPLEMRESIAIARRRFWSILGPRLLVNIVSTVVGIVTGLVLFAVFGFVTGDQINTVVSLLIALVVSAPFVYVPAGVVLGEVGAFEAMERSVRLVMLRKRLAIVITLFGVFSQFIVAFGLGAGLDAVSRLIVGAGLVENFPPVLVVPVVAALVFAVGTLIFLVEAIAAAPAVHAFAALTHYTHGLEAGRREPVTGRRLWDPWVTPGLAVGAVVGLLALVGAVLTLPG